MTVRAVSKSRRTARLVTCTACDGRMESRAVAAVNRFGEPMEGQMPVHVSCGVCNSTGRTKRKMTGCPCCNGPKEDRCGNCANARRGGAEVHACLRPTEDEIAFETEMEFAPVPGTVRGQAGRNHPAADLGQGERAAKY